MDPTGPPAPMLQPLRSTDIDEHADRIVGWQQSYSQLSPGRFDGALLHAAIGDTLLVAERTNQRLRESFTVPADTIVVATATELSGPAHWGAARLDADTVVVCRGGAPTDLLTPRELGLVGVAVPAARAACDALVPGEPLALHDAGAADALRTLFAGALDALRALRAAADAAPPPLAGAIADDAARIAERVAGDVAPVRDPTLARRLALVRRAEAFVAEHGEHAPTVADLCRATGACRRTLQASFVDVLGIGPSRYLRALRLNRARADLKRDAASVSEVAVRWGFWHLGRFAADYRALFGEPPSRTRARARGGRDAADFG